MNQPIPRSGARQMRHDSLSDASVTTSITRFSSGPMPTCEPQPSLSDAMRRAAAAAGMFRAAVSYVPPVGGLITIYEPFNINRAQFDLEQRMGELVATIDEQLDVANLPPDRAELVRRLREDFGPAQRGKQFDTHGAVVEGYLRVLDAYGRHLLAWSIELDCKRAADDLTDRETEVWRALKDHRLTDVALAAELGTEPDNVRQFIVSIRRKKGKGVILTQRGRGYYRPDAPPPESELL